MILAINEGHNASVALIKKVGKKIKCSCIEAERFDRIKMSPCCDRYLGEDFSPSMKSFWINNRKCDFDNIICEILKENETNVEDIETVVLSQNFNLDRLPDKLKNKNIKYFSHHRAHAALAFYTSSFDNAITIVCDGSGEKTEDGFEIQSAWKCSNNGIELIHRTVKENTYKMGIGNAYEIFTYWLNYGYNGCGTTMALASFAKNQTLHADAIFEMDNNGDIFVSKKFIDLEKHIKSMGYKKSGTMAYNAEHEAMLRNIKLPSGYRLRYKESSMCKDFILMASDIQKATENIVVNYINFILNKVKYDKCNICMSGGTFLNCNLNTLIRELDRVQNIHVPTAPGDGGLAVGAALDEYFSCNPRCIVEDTAYIGRKIIKVDLDDNDDIACISPNDINAFSARLIKEGYLVGWCQDNSEFGPRALGNRSLLVDPCNPDLPRKINDRLKHREAFRPFAPVMLEEDFETIFYGDMPIPYMLETRKIRENYREKLSAICHVDDSARIQIVNQYNNFKLYKLLCVIKEKCGMGILINTSLNRNGEPIVDTCEDALNLLKNSLIDYLVVEDTIYYKKGNIYAPELR